MALLTTDFGPGVRAGGGFSNDLITLTGSGLELVPTSTIFLSGWTGPLYHSNIFPGSLFSITEISVDGTAAPTNVPEPSTLAIFSVGLLGLAGMRLVRSKRVSA